MKGGDCMLGYRLDVNCDTKGYLTWSLLFDSPTANYGDTDTDRIFSVSREFVKALANLQPQENVTEPSNKQKIRAIRDTLAEVRLQLNSLHGLLAADVEAPDDTFNINNSELLSRINEADDILATLEHNHDSGCL